jgi:hypothetical protein
MIKKFLNFIMVSLQKVGYKDNNAFLAALMFTVYVMVVPNIVIVMIISSIFFPEFQADKLGLVYISFLTFLVLIPHIVQIFERKKNKIKPLI